MPRPRKHLAVIPTTALVASAARYTGGTERIYQPSQGWQAECYRHYDICGEARFAARYHGHALSRAELFVIKDPVGKERLDNGVVVEYFNQLFNGNDGQTQMLEAIGIHLTVAGECYLVGRKVDGADVWEVISVLEMRVTGKTWTIDYGNGNQPVVLADDDVVIRIWNPNPGRRIEADSPFRSMLSVLKEIEWLTLHIFSQITSRLAGNGILFMPSGMTFPPPPEQDGKPAVTANEADAFMMTFANVAMKALGDPGSPAAKLPIVVTSEAEMINAVKWLTFWSELDENSGEMRKDAIARFALGLDMPPEMLLGMGSNAGAGGGTSNGVSHWGAWQIEESTIKMHTEPSLDLVVNAITIGFLRLLDATTTEAVGYSTADMRLRPDRSKESAEMYDRGSLSEEAMLRENGFDPENDAMGEEERRDWLLRKLATGSATPELLTYALRTLGVDAPMPIEQAPPPAELPPPPSLEEHPQQKEPEASLLLAACEPLVYRALERAGNRMRTNGVKPPNVPAYEVYQFGNAKNPAELLEDAWSCAHITLAGITEDPDAVIEVLDAYTTALLAAGTPHTRAFLAEWLGRSKVLA